MSCVRVRSALTLVQSSEMLKESSWVAPAPLPSGQQIELYGNANHVWHDQHLRLVYRYIDVRLGDPADTEDLVNECLMIDGTRAAFIVIEQPNASTSGYAGPATDMGRIWDAPESRRGHPSRNGP